MQPRSPLRQASAYPVRAVSSEAVHPARRCQAVPFPARTDQQPRQQLEMRTEHWVWANVTPLFWLLQGGIHPSSSGSGKPGLQMHLLWWYPFRVVHRNYQNGKNLKHKNHLMWSSLFSNSSVGGVVWTQSSREISIVNLMQARVSICVQEIEHN